MYALCKVSALARRALAVMAGAVLLAGCAQFDVIGIAPPPPAPLLGPAPVVSVGADQVALLRSGSATFARLALLIASARVSIHVEVYEFGQRGLALGLVAAQSRRVAVTVIDDPSELSSV